MKKRYLIVILIAGIIIFVVSAVHFFERPRVGDVAPPFTLQDAKGNKHSLADCRGEIVFLHFWATWCETCLSEINSIEKLYEEYKDKGIRILTVLVDDDGLGLEAIRRRRGIDYPVLMDPDGKVADTYEVWGVPETFIMDKDGVILERSTKPVRYDEFAYRLGRYFSQ